MIKNKKFEVMNNLELFVSGGQMVGKTLLLVYKLVYFVKSGKLEAPLHQRLLLVQLLIGLQNGHKGFLWNINLSNSFHSLLTTFLLIQ